MRSGGEQRAEQSWAVSRLTQRDVGNQACLNNTSLSPQPRHCSTPSQASQVPRKSSASEMFLLSLPPEILIHILVSLDLRALIACIAATRRLKSIIDGSVLLQYRLATLAACVEDNPWNTDLTSAQKLVTLQKRQTAFAELLPSSVHIIQMDSFPIRTSYMLSGGIFAMIEFEGKALRWVSLASVAPIWERLELDEYILEFGIAAPEVIVFVSWCRSSLRNTRISTQITTALHRHHPFKASNYIFTKCPQSLPIERLNKRS